MVAPQKTDRERPPTHWFGQGIGVAFLLIAAANAASFFFRSQSIDSLFDANVRWGEALGFPFEIWNANGEFGPLYVNYGLMAVNVLVGVAFGLVFGLLAAKISTQLNRWLNEFEARANSQNEPVSMQFSMLSLMGTTAVVGLLVAAVTHWAGTRESLWFIYLLGPGLMIGIAFLPRGIHWHRRCLIVVLVAMVIIPGAIWSGSLRGMEFDRVLLGIFVFWTPQSAFAAFFLFVGVVLQRLRRERNEAVEVED